MVRDLFLVLVGLTVGLFGGQRVPAWVAWLTLIVTVVLLAVLLV